MRTIRTASPSVVRKADRSKRPRAPRVLHDGLGDGVEARARQTTVGSTRRTDQRRRAGGGGHGAVGRVVLRRRARAPGSNPVGAGISPSPTMPSARAASRSHVSSPFSGRTRPDGRRVVREGGGEGVALARARRGDERHGRAAEHGQRQRDPVADGEARRAPRSRRRGGAARRAPGCRGRATRRGRRAPCRGGARRSGPARGRRTPRGTTRSAAPPRGAALALDAADVGRRDAGGPDERPLRHAGVARPGRPARRRARRPRRGGRGPTRCPRRAARRA